MGVDQLKIKDRDSKITIVDPLDVGMGVEVSWEFEGNEITKAVIDPNKTYLLACLSPSREEVIIISSRLKGNDPSAQATVFNLDGSVGFYLIPPALVSEKYNEYEKHVGVATALKSIDFIQPRIKNVDGNVKLLMWIGFAYDWFEERELNAKTGEFGECFGTSRL